MRPHGTCGRGRPGQGLAGGRGRPRLHAGGALGGPLFRAASPAAPARSWRGWKPSHGPGMRPPRPSRGAASARCAANAPVRGAIAWAVRARWPTDHSGIGEGPTMAMNKANDPLGQAIRSSAPACFRPNPQKQPLFFQWPSTSRRCAWQIRPCFACRSPWVNPGTAPAFAPFARFALRGRRSCFCCWSVSYPPQNLATFAVD